jgi:site-specific DNA recombinase
MTVAVGYVRVSTQDQAREGHSLAAQRRRIAAYCEAQGWDLAEIYADEGVSGTTIDRPGFSALLDRALTGEGVDRIVFLKLDRLGRSAWRMGEVRERIERRGVGLVSITEQFDTSTSMGRFFWTLLAAFAEFERDMIRDRASLGLDEKARRGRGWVTGRPPFGYRAAGGDLVPHPEEAEVVRRIFAAAASGRTPPSIAREVAATGVARSGASEWTRAAVRRILRNPVYAGSYLSLGEHRCDITPLVDAETWRRAQEGRSHGRVA